MLLWPKRAAAVMRGPCAGMRGLKRDHSLRIVATGHAFVQNLRRGHYELATEASVLDRVAVAFTEPALAV